MNQKNNDAIHKAIMNSGRKARGAERIKVTVSCPYCGNTDLRNGGGTYGCDDCACVFLAGPMSEEAAKAIAEVLPKLLPRQVIGELSDGIPAEVAKHLPKKKKKS